MSSARIQRIFGRGCLSCAGIAAAMLPRSAWRRVTRHLLSRRFLSRRFGRNLYTLGVPPQPFQVVVGARPLQEDMADQVTIILQDPLAVVIAFQAHWQLAAVLH